MAYLQNFLRLVASGTLHDTEGFSYGMSFINDFGGGVAPTEVPAGVITALRTFHENNRFHTGVVLRTIKLNEIGTDGRYVSDQTVLHDLNPGAFGTGALVYPPQTALAVTLDTGTTRGRAARGRFYLPPLTVAVGSSDGLISAADRDTLAAAVVAMVDAVETALPGWDLGVVSDIGTGTQRAVTGIRVGRVYDTIRSRRRSIPENYNEPTPHTPDV